MFIAHQRDAAWRLVVLLALAAGCRGAAPASPDPTPLPASPPTVQILETPAGIDSLAPGLVSGPDGATHLTWIEAIDGGKHALRHSVRSSAGAWSAPSTIASGADWFVNWADTPALAVGPGSRRVAHWMSKVGEATYAYQVEFSTSEDGGETWSAPRRLHDDDSPTEHGFVSLLPRAGGETLAVWLDGRGTASEGPMTLRSRSIGVTGDLGAEEQIDDRTCDCCPTSLAALSDGAIAAWRDRSDTEVRDIAVSRLRRGTWEAPRVVAPDAWTMPGCAVNGPALAVQGSSVVLAWFTEEAEAPRVQVSVSLDGGETFGAPRVLSRATLGRVSAVSLSTGGSVVSWLERTADAAALVAVRLNADGEPTSAPIEVAQVAAGRRTGIPRAAAGAADHVVFAWTEVVGDSTRVRSALVGPF